jgi:hypothetical protein
MHPIHPPGESRRHELLDCHHTIQIHVLGQIDNAEATFADQTNDLKVGNNRTDGQAIGMCGQQIGRRC